MLLLFNHIVCLCMCLTFWHVRSKFDVSVSCFCLQLLSRGLSFWPNMWSYAMSIMFLGVILIVLSYTLLIKFSRSILHSWLALSTSLSRGSSCVSSPPVSFSAALSVIVSSCSSQYWILTLCKTVVGIDGCFWFLFKHLHDEVYHLFFDNSSYRVLWHNKHDKT